MRLKDREERTDGALPPLRHWLSAAVILFAMTLVVPVIAGLT